MHYNFDIFLLCHGTLEIIYSLPSLPISSNPQTHANATLSGVFI